MKQKSPTSAKTIFFLIGLFSFLLNPGIIIAQQVSTHAGFGIGDSDGLIGSCAQFSGPNGLAMDSAGNIYVADELNHSIRKIAPDGTVTTFAGNGTQGFADGPGSDARFSFPFGLTIDESDNLYIADSGNNRIRKISPDGTVTTIAGDGNAGSDDGTSSVASFNQPTGLVLDNSGNIIITDFSNHKIRVLSTDGTVSTLAGNLPGSSDGVGAAASFSNPIAIALSPNGNYYVSQQGEHKIRMVTPDGTVSTLAGSGSMGSNDGIGANASFYYPMGLFCDNSGNLYVADNGNNKIRKISPAGSVTTFAGDSGGFADGDTSVATFSGPSSILIDSFGNFYISDRTNSKIRIINSSGNVSTLAGSGLEGFADGPGTSASFNEPKDLVFDSVGNIYLTNRYSIRKISTSGVVTTIAGSSHGGSNDGIGSNASFEMPTALTLDPSGNIFVTDYFYHNIRKIAPDGTVTTFAGSGAQGSADGMGTNASFNYPNDIVSDSDGNLFVADYLNNKIRKITPDGNVTTFAGTGNWGTTDGAGNAATFQAPLSLFCDQNNILYVLEESNTIRKVLPDGTVSSIPITFVTGGFFGNSTGFISQNHITVDANGIIYVSDDYKIHRITPNGICTILAGDEYNNNNGNPCLDGVRYNASFNYASGIICAPDGMIYVADQFNNKIRMITPCQTSESFNVVTNAPSIAGSCNGVVAIHPNGLGITMVAVDGGFFLYTVEGTVYLADQCPGVHDLQLVTACEDTIHAQYVIPLETNFIVNNTYPDSTAVDTLGVTLIDCTIDYTSISEAYIDSSWFTNDTVTVVWNIVDNNGIHTDTAVYFLDDPNGVYWLQLNLFCPNRSQGDCFSVMQTIYFNGDSLLNVSNNPHKSIGVFVFPNPTDHLFTIQTTANKIMASIRDSQGKLIQTFSINQTTTIDASEWSDGIYFLEIQSEEGRATERLIKL